MKTPKPSDRPAGTPEATGAGADPAAENATAVEPSASKPGPEPMTPARVLEWNAYYDLFVAGFALLLCFVASAAVIDNATLWSHLAAGRLIDRQGGPITTEPFSYAVPEGTRWVDVPWIFQWVSYKVYGLGESLAQAIERPAEAEQFGAGALVALSATLRTLAALLLLLIRHRGPGLWWVAMTTALALGVVVTPLGGDPIRVALGGTVGAGAVVSPGTWGLVLLTVELLLLHQAYNLGRRRALFGLVPLFALWANVDESFAIGLMLLTARVLGDLVPVGVAAETEGEAGPRPGISAGLATLGLSALACLANPSTVGVYPVAFGPILGVFGPAPETLLQDQVTLLPFGVRGEQSRTLFFQEEYPRFLGAYLLLVLLGLGSFLLNRRRFSPGRLAMFLVSALLAAMLFRLQEVLGLVLAACLALNGQEWYQSTFGTEGKTSLGWRVWSVGGRLATLAFLTLATLLGLTGYGKRYGEPPFGFGMEADRFAFEAADFLREAPIEGRVMNLRLSLGDAINWRTYPIRQSFVDSRLPSSAAHLLTEYDTVRNALVDGEDQAWREILDRYGVSVLMVDVPGVGALNSPLTDALDASRDWQAFYDDGLVLLYGRLDESTAVSQADREYFLSQGLDAEAIAFGRGNPPRPWDRPPQPTDFLDRFSNTRALAPVQPHVLAARRWLDRGSRAAGGAGAVPGIASCLLAIQEARDALSVRPDDPDAFFVLALAYRSLGQQEAELLAEAGDPDLLAGRLTPPINLRQQQRITALNAFLRTAPRPAASPEARVALRGAHLELAGLYETAGFLDLTRDQLGAALDLFDTAETASEDELASVESIRLAFEALTEQVEQVRAQIEQAELEQQLPPDQLGSAAISEGLAETALGYLIDAERSGIGTASVRMQLVDLLCNIGRPDEAIEYLGGGDEQGLSSGPGTAQFRQGRVYFLMGDYRTAAELWRSLALPQLQAARAEGAMQTATLMLTGQPMAAVQAALNVPAQLSQQAEWEYLLGICLLEGGFPAEAGPHFRSSLELNPELQGRPIAAFYLEKLGLDVPPPPPSEEEGTPAEAEPGEAGETGATDPPAGPSSGADSAGAAEPSAAEPSEDPSDEAPAPGSAPSPPTAPAPAEEADPAPAPDPAPGGDEAAPDTR
ncbi:tetratricopeptide repeat protein [Tautonia sociabilis]|uniref:tetratricopeptide repeat protein n=1 Tax=Tautonia sociabilis TaxID=2080755 RepID=UPI001315A9E5|nr:tetratricopeptide repeat protein [Tautonia sociabilis]